jgi:hypothetical protein
LPVANTGDNQFNNSHTAPLGQGKRQKGGRKRVKTCCVPNAAKLEENETQKDEKKAAALQSSQGHRHRRTGRFNSKEGL